MDEPSALGYSHLPMDVVLEVLSYLTISKPSSEKFGLFGYKNWDVNRSIVFLFDHFDWKGDAFEEYETRAIFVNAVSIVVNQVSITDACCRCLRRNRLIEKFNYNGGLKFYNENLCSALSECHTLRKVKLRTVFDTSFKYLFGLPNLQSLNIYTGFQAVPPEEFTFGFVQELKESKLKVLVLTSGEGFTDEHLLFNLFQLPNLKILYLENQKITKETVEKVNHTTIKNLILERCSMFSDQGAEALSKLHAPNLSILKLSSCMIRTQGLKKLFNVFNADFLNQLEYLEMSKNQNMKDGAFSKLAGFTFERILTVDLNHCCGLTDTGIMALTFSIFNTVEVLKLKECNLTFSSFALIGRKCKNLQRLDISMNNISFPETIEEHEDDTLSYDEEYFLNLETLKLSDNKITDIEWLIDRIPHKIDQLNLSGNHLKETQLDKLLRKCEVNYLGLERCMLTDSFIMNGCLTHESSGVTIKSLRINDNDVTDEAVKKLLSVQKLDKLFLSGNKQLTKETLQRFYPIHMQ